ncbi:MAG: hypothetical protein QOE55_7833 [Acidobacteriaceae bacterium]|nr:hypothetical protein [Acidobacteriaceae bacterium]
MSADNPSNRVQSMCSLLTVLYVPKLLVLRQSATPTVNDSFYPAAPAWRTRIPHTRRDFWLNL